MGEAVTPGDPLVRVTLVEDEGPQPLPLVEEDRLTLPPQRVSSRVRSELRPPSIPSGSGAEKGENAKKRKLNWHSKCLQAAVVEVKFPKEG